MMENNSTPSPDPVPEASPIAVPVPAESAVTPPPAPLVIPLRERPNAPLLHKGFQNLFRLGIANIVINLLNNTFKLGDKIPALGIGRLRDSGRSDHSAGIDLPVCHTCGVPPAHRLRRSV